MKRERIRVRYPRVGRERAWLEVPPLDPRDPDILRAKRKKQGDDVRRPPRVGGTRVGGRRTVRTR